MTMNTDWSPSPCKTVDFFDLFVLVLVLVLVRVPVIVGRFLEFPGVSRTIASASTASLSTRKSPRCAGEGTRTI
jgi:hypothetical protein